MREPLRIAVAGLGTVGVGVLRVLRDNAALIRARAGRALQVVAVSARHRGRDRGVDIADLTWCDDVLDLADLAGVDAVVELIGGDDGPAKALTEAAIAAGKPVVTANKALLAVHGTDLARAAERAGVTLAYEAAVAGGVPIVKALREGLGANRIGRVHGILNGTCNYILTEMRETGRDFDAVLAEAQALGYAEADPGTDIDGIDAAHKLAILTSLAFGTVVNFGAVYVAGIRRIGALDIAYAGELGYRIKLLGIARETADGIEQRVHPCMVPERSPIAAVDGVFNAVVVDGDFVERTVFEGQGAGQGPTASAVVADLIDLAAGRRPPTFGIPATALREATWAPMSGHVGPYYVRLQVYDRPGVIADISAILRDEAISIESLLQRGRSASEAVPVVLISHEAEEAAMRRAFGRIGELESVLEPPRLIRIETL